MKQSDVKIKVLRQNFIKKHQINPDYFTLQDQYDLENLEFCDQYLYYPKHPRSDTNKQQSLATYRSSGHKKALSIPTMTALVTDQKKSTKFHKFHEKIPPNSPQQRQVGNPKLKMSVESNFIKSQKIKKRKSSTNQAKILPNFAVFIMKPCNIKPIKISPRPFSAFVNLKKQSLKSSREMKQRSVSQKLHRKKSSILQPWQTAENQF